MSVSEFAELVGVSTRTVSDLVKRKIIQREAGGLPHPEFVQKYCRHLAAIAAGRGGEAAAEVAKHRSELLKIQAEKARFSLDVEQDKYCTIDDVEANWSGAFRAIRSAMLTLPTRIASRVPGTTREMLYEMDQEIRLALTELGRAGYPLPGSPEDIAAKNGEAA